MTLAEKVTASGLSYDTLLDCYHDVRLQAALTRIAAIEAEKEFLRQLLATPFEDAIAKIKDYLRKADVQIGVEQGRIDESTDKV